jgi:hypothetical protein
VWFIIIISIYLYFSSSINVLTSSERYSCLVHSTLSVWVCHCTFYSSFLYTCHLSLYARSHSQEKSLLGLCCPFPSACPHAPERPCVPEDGFPWYLIMGTLISVTFYENISRSSRSVSIRDKSSGHYTWRPKNISLFPASMKLHKGNGKMLLGWPKKDEQCCVTHTLNFLWHFTLTYYYVGHFRSSAHCMFSLLKWIYFTKYICRPPM